MCALTRSNISEITTARLQVRCISIEGLPERDGLNWPSAIALAGESSRLLLRLPEVENCVAVRFVEIIGGGGCSRPVPAFAIGHTHNPGAGRSIATVAEPELLAQLEEYRLTRNREPQPADRVSRVADRVDRAIEGLYPACVPRTGENTDGQRWSVDQDMLRISVI